MYYLVEGDGKGGCSITEILCNDGQQVVTQLGHVSTPQLATDVIRGRTWMRQREQEREHEREQGDRAHA